MQTPNNSIILVIAHPKNPDKPSIELTNVCHRIKKQNAAQQLFNHWPNLRQASYKLAGYLTRYWPDPHKREDSLLAACLDHALERTDSLYKNDTDGLEIQKAFIETIAQDLVLSLQFSLMIRTKSAWLPHEVNGIPLDEIIQSNPISSLMWTDTPLPAHDREESKLICASRVFSLNELQLGGLIG